MRKYPGLVEPGYIKAALVLRALTNKINRLIILEISCSNNRRSLPQIVHHLNLLESVASKHLAILRYAKVITLHKDGDDLYYSVDHKAIDKIKAACTQIL